MLKSTYQTTRFEGLFRKTKINVYQQATNGAPPGLATHQSPHINGLQPAENQYYQSPYQLTSSPLTGSQAPTASSLKGSPDSTHASALNPTAPTWASTAMTAPPYVASPPPTPQPTPQRVSVVPRNRYGQRIDPVIQFDANEVKRIKSKKMCNVHFLRDDCPYDPCTHDHHYKPTKNELTTLRYVSRLTPCKFGSECDDLKCIYGHVCPNSVDGKKDWYVHLHFPAYIQHIRSICPGPGPLHCCMIMRVLAPSTLIYNGVQSLGSKLQIRTRATRYRHDARQDNEGWREVSQHPSTNNNYLI